MHQRLAKVSIYYLPVDNMFFIVIFIREAQKTEASILWNVVWVLLAIPVVWMSWWVPKPEKKAFTY